MNCLENLPKQHYQTSRAADPGLTRWWTKPAWPKNQQLGVIVSIDREIPLNVAFLEAETIKGSKMRGLPLLSCSSCHGPAGWCCRMAGNGRPLLRGSCSCLHWNKHRLNQDIKMEKFLMSNLEITFPFSTPRDTPCPIHSAPQLIFNTSFMHPWQFHIQMSFPRSPHHTVKDAEHVADFSFRDS